MKPSAALALMILLIPAVYAQSDSSGLELGGNYDGLEETAESIEAEAEQALQPTPVAPELAEALELGALENEKEEPDGDTMLEGPTGQPSDLFQ